MPRRLSVWMQSSQIVCVVASIIASSAARRPWIHVPLTQNRRHHAQRRATIRRSCMSCATSSLLPSTSGPGPTDITKDISLRIRVPLPPASGCRGGAEQSCDGGYADPGQPSRARPGGSRVPAASGPLDRRAGGTARARGLPARLDERQGSSARPRTATAGVASHAPARQRRDRRLGTSVQLSRATFQIHAERTQGSRRRASAARPTPGRLSGTRASHARWRCSPAGTRRTRAHGHPG